MKVYTYGPQVRAKLRSLGLKPNHEANARAIVDPGERREYWWLGDGTDAMLDHSVTVHRTRDRKFLVSGFGKFREMF